jgi:hypothetical protein
VSVGPVTMLADEEDPMTDKPQTAADGGNERDENGEPTGTFDVFDYIKLCQQHYDKVGLGADYVQKLFR